MKKIYLAILLFITPLFMLSAQNLVLNGGFESWDNVNTPTSWTKVENATQEATIVNTGTYSCQHIGGTKDLGQTIPVVAGTNYELSFSYYIAVGDGFDCRSWSFWMNGTTQLDDNLAELRPSTAFDFQAVPSWKTSTVSITAPATATDLYLEVRTYGSGTTVYWDDFSLVAVADLDAPVWSAGYPMAANVTETSFDIATMLDETSTAYYVVLASGDAAPSVAEVMAGTGAAAATAVASGTIASGTSETLEPVTGLITDVSYTVYMVAEDDESSPNVQDALVSFEVTPTTPPSVLLLADFATDLTPFTEFSEAGDTKTWYFNTDHAEANAYQSPDAEIDWLISPEYDFTGITAAEVAFSASFKFGTNDDTHFLKFYYSEDYDGNTANLTTATWVEIVFPLPAYDTWTDMGPFDISAITGKAYFAFVYNYPDNYSNWKVDDFKILGFAPQGSDASLSDLLVDATTLSDFDGAKTSYIVELAPGTTTVPTVTLETTDANATAVITDATDLTGDDAARTTTIVVTAQDGNTVQTYSILFNPVLEMANIAELRAATDLSRKYVVTGEVVLTQKDGFRNKKYFEDATGAMEIDDNPGVITSVYEIGDVVTGLTGTLELYNGWLQMHPTDDPGASTSTALPVEPQVLTVSEFTSNFASYAAEFVKIEGVTFADAGGSFGNGKDYVVNVGADASVVRTHFYNVVTGAIPNMADVQGVAVWHYAEAKIGLRMQSDLMPYSSDASLSDLMVDAVQVTGFAAGTMSYDVLLGVGTTTVPTVTYTTTDAGATAVVTDATDLFGDEAARTTSVEVTAADGTVATYTIVFTVDNTGLDNSMSTKLTLYPVPATDVLNIKGMNGVESIEIVNVVGNVVKRMNVESEMMSINISNLSAGVYFVRANESTYRFIKK